MTHFLRLILFVSVTDLAYSQTTTNATFGAIYACTKPWLRMWNSAFAYRDHYYTTSATEQATAAALGYIDEGSEVRVIIARDDPDFVDSCQQVCTASRTELYQLYSRTQKRDHMYTTDITERINAQRPINGGYYGDGTKGWVVTTNNTCGATVPVYRFLNAGLGFNADHFYSTNSAAPARYVSEGIAFYGWA